MDMIKVSATAGEIKKEGSSVWDEKGRCKIAKIFMSHGTQLFRSIQFLFVDENGHFALSDKHGADHGFNFITVVFDYPSEFVTGIRGTYYTNGLRSITFDTNKGSHGPYGSIAPLKNYGEFNLPIGNDGTFGGFYGTNTDTLIEDIGMYVKPITSSMIEPGGGPTKARVAPASFDGNFMYI